MTNAAFSCSNALKEPGRVQERITLTLTNAAESAQKRSLLRMYFNPVRSNNWNNGFTASKIEWWASHRVWFSAEIRTSQWRHRHSSLRFQT